MNKLFRIFAATLAAACILSLAGCSGSNSSSSSKDADSSSSQAVSSSVPESSASSAVENSSAADDQSGAASSIEGLEGLNANGKFDTITDFVNSDMMQEQIASLKGNLEDAGMGLEIGAEDNKLIYRYTVSGVTEDTIEVMAEALSTAMEGQASLFESVASALKAAVEVEDPVVVVTYLTESGEEIYSQEFTSGN